MAKRGVWDKDGVRLWEGAQQSGGLPDTAPVGCPKTVPAR